MICAYLSIALLVGLLSNDNGPAPDPNVNTDTCDGGRGNNLIVFCEN
jgi:hypothetical protein